VHRKIKYGWGGDRKASKIGGRKTSWSKGTGARRVRGCEGGFKRTVGTFAGRRVNVDQNGAGRNRKESAASWLGRERNTEVSRSKAVHGWED